MHPRRHHLLLGDDLAALPFVSVSVSVMGAVVMGRPATQEKGRVSSAAGAGRRRRSPASALLLLLLLWLLLRRRGGGGADAAELGRATAAPMRLGAAGGRSARAWLCGGAGPGAGRGLGGAAGVVVIPPSCGHRIQFKLYVLDDEVIKDKLMDAIEGHVLGEAKLMAVF
uniref:Uncharacterized protein n=1 Tax=Oryza sativa subsp. japonica TaxID=39947 RepID=Q69MI8_ORYSJ|nr:hypothetical protein [Oryza sativa Japonica Group]